MLFLVKWRFSFFYSAVFFILLSFLFAFKLVFNSFIYLHICIHFSQNKTGLSLPLKVDSR